MNKFLRKRFDELLSQADEVAATKQRKHSSYIGSYDHVDSDMLLGWCVKHATYLQALVAAIRNISILSSKLKSLILMMEIKKG